MPQSHVEGYCEHPRTRLVCLIDTNIEAADRAAERVWKNDSISTDAMCMLEQLCPDIVSICTPEHTHLSVFLKMLRHHTPRAVFVEKPLATSRDGCERIVSLCRSHRIVLAVNHARAWDSDIRRLRPTVIGYGGGPWRNDVHAHHLARLLGPCRLPRVEKVSEESGLWLDGRMVWGSLQRNTMFKAITDILQGIEEGKEPRCGGADATSAVIATLREREISGTGHAG